MVQLWNPLLPCSFLLYQYVPHPLHSNLWIHPSDFHTRTGHYSNFWTPPPVLSKHPIWYSLDADFFILIWGVLYGLHWWHFQNSPLFQEIITHGEKQLIGLLPWHPIPFDILKNNLFDHFLILLYQGSFQLNHLTRDDWIDLKRLCVDWYFPGQTAIIIQKFCDLRHCRLPPIQRLLVLSVPTQQIIRRLNWEEEQQQKVHLIQIKESDEENCVEDNST